MKKTATSADKLRVLAAIVATVLVKKKGMVTPGAVASKIRSAQQ